MKEANVSGVGIGKTTQTIQVVYPVYTAKINPCNNIHKQYLPDVTLYRSPSSGRVLFAESGRNDA